MAQEIEITRASLRTPRAAAIAGIAFALLLGTALVLVRVAVPANPRDAANWLDDAGRRNAVVVALNLVPFAGLAFLWFIGAVRDRIGAAEDRFFAIRVPRHGTAVRRDALRRGSARRRTARGRSESLRADLA